MPRRPLTELNIINYSIDCVTGMCPIVLRLLINMYINQKIQVKWDNVLSKQYSISNGVKQGGCLSLYFLVFK